MHGISFYTNVDFMIPNVNLMVITETTFKELGVNHFSCYKAFLTHVQNQ